VLKTVIRALRDAQLIAAHSVVHSNVTFKNNCLFLNLHCDDAAYYHVRASDTYDYAREFASNLDAATRFPHFAPFPLSTGSINGISWIAYDGLRLQPVTARQLMRARPRTALHDGLLAFARETRKQTDISLAVAQDVAEVSDTFLGHTSIPMATIERLEEVRSDPLIMSLPQCMQHGDLAINNIAMADGKLTIIDWEDFGKVTVAGFDLAVLAASAMEFDPVRLSHAASAMQASRARNLAWLANAYQACGLSPTVFSRALPLYLWMFLRLRPCVTVYAMHWWRSPDRPGAPHLTGSPRRPTAASKQRVQLRQLRVPSVGIADQLARCRSKCACQIGVGR
jgi:hypothetical protein